MTEVNDILILGEEKRKEFSKTKITLIALGVLLVVSAATFGALIYFKGDAKTPDQLLANAELKDGQVEITKAKIDSSEYKLITLKGGQEVLMIKGNKKSKFGAAVSVHTGSLTDFFKYEGLAHMSEHALFGGSKKYGANEFLTYCQNMGGNVNAETFDEYTTYLFELLSQDTFNHAMDILANQVLYPTFDEEYVFGESLNVNSEYINSYETDDEKLNKIIKANSRKDGPFYQLTVGTYDTLRNGKTRKEFVETIKRYYRDHYKPKDMKLVVQGPVEFSVLEKAANDFFATVPSSTSNLQRENPVNDENPEERYYNINAFPPENRQRLVWWNSNSATPTVNFVFYIDLNSKQTNLVNPHALIEYHFNSKEKNSFSDKLISEGLALSVSTDHSSLFSDFTLLYIKVNLTDAGLNKVNDIGKYLFSYIKKIQESDNSSIIDQIKKNAANKFDFTESNPDIFDSINLATINLHYSDKASVMNRDFNYTKLTKEAQDSIFKFLTPEYLLILVGTNKKDDNLLKTLSLDNESIWTEAQYNTDFAFRKLNPKEITDFKNATSEGFSIRLANEYSTKKEKLLDPVDCNATPNLVSALSSESAVFSYKIEKCYKTPKVAGQVDISANVDQENKNDDIAALEILNAKLQYFTSALINSLVDGGSEASITFSGSAFNFRFNIFSDLSSKAVFEFINAVTKKVFDTTNDSEALFDKLKSTAKNNLKDRDFDEPRNLVNSYFSTLTSDHILPADRKDSVNNLTLNSYKARVGLLNATLRAKVLLVGDVDINSLEGIINSLTDFKGKVSTSQKFYSIKTEKVIDFVVKNSVDSKTNSAIGNYYKINNDGISDTQKKSNNFTGQLVAKFMGGEYFDNLRTIQKLGYFARSGYLQSNGESYITLQLMGPKNLKNAASSPTLFNEKFDVVTESLNKFQNIKEEKLNEFKQSIIDSLNQGDALTLNELANNSWNLFNLPTPTPTPSPSEVNETLKADNDIDIINRITLAEVQTMFADIFYDHPYKLSVRVYSNQDDLPVEGDIKYKLKNAITESIVTDKDVLKK